VLSTDTEAPVVTETTVSTDLLQALKIVTELAVDAVGEDLAVLAIDDIALPVEEPTGDLVCDMSERNMELMHPRQRTLEGVLDDGDDTLELFGGEVTSALAEIDIGLLADQVGVAATDTLDLGQGVHDLLLSIDVRVQQTDDVLEAGRRQHCSSVFSNIQHKSPTAYSLLRRRIFHLGLTLSSSLKHAGPPHVTALTTCSAVILRFPSMTAPACLQA
jgi:hypothetical protein